MADVDIATKKKQVSVCNNFSCVWDNLQYTEGKKNCCKSSQLHFEFQHTRG